MQWNLNVQQQFGQSTVVMVGYAGNRGMNQIVFSDYNMPFAVFNGVSLEVPVGATRQNPLFNAIKYYANGGDSWYNGLNVNVQRRFTGGFQTQVAYTWSKTLSTADAASTTDTTGSGGGNPRYPHDLRVVKGLSGYHASHVLSVNYMYELPGARGMSGVARYVLGGWQLSGIVSAKSGQPFMVTSGTPTALSGLGISRTPNLNPNFDLDKVILGTPNNTPGTNRYFDPSAFLFPGPREIGNLGKNFLTGPGQMTWDASLTKNTGLSERMRLQFKSEFFNILNRANFRKPSSSVFGNNGLVSGNVGRITGTTGTARHIQLGLKLIF